MITARGSTIQLTFAFTERDSALAPAILKGERSPCEDTFGRNQEPATRNQQPGTSNQEPGTRNQKPGTRNQKPGTRNQQPGTRNQKPGIPNFLEAALL